MTSTHEGTFEGLRAQLQEAAATFADGPDALEGILLGIVDDVDHAVREPLEIFPVCHHSPASAIAMARRLREKQPKVVYLELCEDMAPLLTELRNCKLPVAVQSFATEVDGFPVEWSPLSVVAPITEASAEYQAIAYALDTPGVELVLVDRSSDHVFQWDARATESAEPAAPDTPPAEEEAALHGDAVGVEIGDLRPRFAELEEHLLHHGKVRHWSEWWHQYVELPLGDSDHDTYRQVMLLIGSLFRRLAPGDAHRVRVDEDRERYMWTRMREHLAATGADPADCLYVCGAFHAASRVAEFGVHGTDTFEISPPSATTWQHGLIPSSHAAIEAQFGLAAGSVSIAATVWAKNVRRTRVEPFRLAGQAGAKKSRAKKAAAPVGPVPEVPPSDKLTGFLQRPPALDRLDEAELLGWSVEIVRAARRNGYLASTADAIAVFETSILLAGMRDRAKPTPYDFQDAAVTCIEKDTVPGRRDVRRLVEIMMGGDRVGQVGYEALPPLARDVHDRLAPLGLKLQQSGVQRALLDIASQPELERCSDALWMLRYLMPQGAARPIMGERKLGERPIQESWDLALGTYQRALIELGYEGVSIEQVLEQRLRRTAYDRRATAATVLEAVEDATLYLRSRRLADELGTHALEVLSAERSVDGAPEVLRRVRRLLAYYRTSEPVLPPWIESFAKTGYAHYCTLLPTAFTDEDATVRQVAAMLGFLFSMESLALSLGCDRTQLELAVAQSHPEEPSKTALLWAAQVQLGHLSRAELRAKCDELLGNPLVVPAYPRYLSGFVHALEPVPGLTDFVVEAVSNAFARLPDPVLLPWLPTLITTLRSGGSELAPLLIREAGRTFPGRLATLDAWVPPWRSRPDLEATLSTHSMEGAHGCTILAAHPATCDAVAGLLGWEVTWETAEPDRPAGAALLGRHPETAVALEVLLSGA
ncbi:MULTISPECIES: DUF5682 family protein [unclassified Streptomyces]|uniref:DUF5682 family protein n=1 Tax=unclassified Streptomyces TaxID=2593676 RepID=UPI000F5C0D36|nr:MULTISPECIES: DUF5682 family protein [unclassified Streptomyces]RPK60927.1 hypothetical protein EES42_32990 [Streptomyces sp. ADI95-17]WSC25814.1 DUF5682 family protein [Streptomyces sp. NBC_01768]WSG48853.1 DUF5682 family protein [Streptomyces sp. NBC_01732]WSW99503.1 DUF5682 family protein [Streptomyces sp. NBC_00987]